MDNTFKINSDKSEVWMFNKDDLVHFSALNGVYIAMEYFYRPDMTEFGEHIEVFE